MKKRYGKARWIDTRLSEPYKARKRLAIIYSASAFAVAGVQLRAIASAAGGAGEKAIAFAETYLQTISTVKKTWEDVKR
jgi:hypothetical protein